MLSSIKFKGVWVVTWQFTPTPVLPSSQEAARSVSYHYYRTQQAGTPATPASSTVVTLTVTNHKSGGNTGKGQPIHSLTTNEALTQTLPTHILSYIYMHKNPNIHTCIHLSIVLMLQSRTTKFTEILSEYVLLL